MRANFYGYSVSVKSLRHGQMVIAQAKREAKGGDIDAWFYAGMPVGKAYSKWTMR